MTARGSGLQSVSSRALVGLQEVTPPLGSGACANASSLSPSLAVTPATSAPAASAQLAGATAGCSSPSRGLPRGVAAVNVAISSRSRRDLVAARSRSDLGAFSAGRSAQAQSSRGGASVPEAAGLPAAAARLRHGAERVGHRTCVEHMTMMHGRLPSPLCLPSECSELRREGAWGQRTARRRRAGGRRGGEIEPLQRRGRHPN